MRSQKEIIERIEAIKNDDFFGHETNDYVSYLTYENAKKYIRKGVKKKDWRPENQKKLKEKMFNYMKFAFEKANNFRGLSAMRSLAHYRAWLWLDNNEKLSSEILSEKKKDYLYYGKDVLVKICKYLGIDSKKFDDGARRNEEP